MTIKVGDFTSWQSSSATPKLQTYKKASPNLLLILDHIRANFPGPPKNNGNYDLRPIRGGSAWSSHAFGAAQDVSFRGLANWEAVKRDVIAFLVENSAELGVQGVHDYSGPGLTGNSDRGYIWRSNRSDAGNPAIGWKKQNASSSGMGQSWADWIHYEVSESAWYEVVPVADRLSGVPPLPAFDPAAGEWGLWPLNPDKPVLSVGGTHPDAAEATRYLQGVLNTTGAGLLIDGDYNPAVEQFVIDLQQREGLEVDGRVGRNTWSAIDALAAAPPGTSPAPPPRPTDPPPADPSVFDPENGQFGAFPDRDDKPRLELGHVGDPDEVEATRYLHGVVASINYVPDQDGSYGERTVTVIEKIQTSNGLPATGVVDAATWKVIDTYARS